MKAVKLKTSVMVSSALSIMAHGASTIPPKVDEKHWKSADLAAPSIDYSQPKLATMLNVWNQVNDELGMKCADCHSSPNASEFKVAGISDEDILRRGLVHHSQDDIKALIEGAEYLANVLGLPSDVDREDKFIMQKHAPEGENYWNRDFNFVKYEISRINPSIMGDIKSLADVERVMDEILQNASNPHNIRWPFESPVYSGDTFHQSERGEHTGTIHKWVSVVPIQPTNMENQAIIEERRASYLAHPSNQNFYDYYQAIQHGAGPFGFPLDDYGNRHNRRNQKRSAAVDTHPFAKDLNGEAADYEVQKYLMGLIAFHDETQQEFKAAGLIDETYLENPLNTFPPHAREYAQGTSRTFDFTYLRVGDAAGQPTGKARLSYPPFVIDNFLSDDFYGSNRLETEQIMTDHARLGAQDWWAMTKVYGWGALFGTAFYWQDDMLNYGVPFTENTSGREVTRENAKLGYPAFQLWASMRAAVLQRMRQHKAEVARSNGEKSLDDIRVWEPLHFDLRTFKGLMNPDGLANSEHAALNKTLAVNIMKMILMVETEKMRRDAQAGNTYAYNRGKNDIMSQYHKMGVFIQWVERDRPEDAAVIKGLVEEQRALQIELYGEVDGEKPYPANGDGLIFTSFDDQAMTIPLSTMRLADINLDRTFVDREAYPFTYAMKTKPTTDTPLSNPVASGNLPGFGMRWEGYIQAPFTDVFDFGVISADGLGGHGTQTHHLASRVYIDGNLVWEKRNGEKTPGIITNTASARPTELNVGVMREEAYFIPMEKGQLYHLRVEIDSPDESDRVAQLVWASPNKMPLDVVPPQYFYTSQSSARDPENEVPTIALNGNIAIRQNEKSISFESIALEYELGDEIDYQLVADGGDGELTWEMGWGNPTNLSLSSGGRLTGVASLVPNENSPGKARTHSFSVIAKDADGDVDVQWVDLRIGPNGNGNTPIGSDAPGAPAPTDPEPGNTAPVASLYADYVEGYEGLVVNFNAGASSDPEGDDLKYFWDFGSGFELGSAMESMTFPEAGTYNIGVKVNDGEYDSDPDTVTITVHELPNSAPEARLSISQSEIQAGESILFNASASTDPEGSNLNYFWNFGEGFAEGNAIMTHVFPSAGQYSVQMKVSDGQHESAVESVNIQVTEAVPSDPVPQLVNIGLAEGEFMQTANIFRIDHVSKQDDNLAQRSTSDAITFISLVDGIKTNGEITVKLSDISGGALAGIMLRDGHDSDAPLVAVTSGPKAGSRRLIRERSGAGLQRSSSWNKPFLRIRVEDGVAYYADGFERNGNIVWSESRARRVSIDDDFSLGLVLGGTIKDEEVSGTIEVINMVGF